MTIDNRPQSRPRQRYKEELKRTISSCNLSPNNWEEVSLDRPTWRSLSTEGVYNFKHFASLNATAVIRLYRQFVILHLLYLVSRTILDPTYSAQRFFIFSYFLFYFFILGRAVH